MKIPLLKRHLDNNTNFNIGDFVKIYEYYNIFDWYSNETYEIINIKNNIIILDRYLPKDRNNVKTNKIYYNKIYIDIPYTRKMKINKIKERLRG